VPLRSPGQTQSGKKVADAKKRDEIAASLEVSPPLLAQADEVIEREGTFLSRFWGRSGGMVARGGGARIVVAYCSGHG
jgi:hypothetical protein